MWHGYHYRILDSWTPGLVNAPRWLGANAYPELSDYEPLPEESSFGPSEGLILSDNGALPGQWLLSADTVPASGNNLQRYFDTIAAERAALAPAAMAAIAARASLLDTAEPDCAWYLDVDETIHTLEVPVITASGYNWIKVAHAPSDLDLFYSGGWRFRQKGRTILIYGLGLQEQRAQRRSDGDWQFVRHSLRWTPGRMAYFQHPHTKNWIPLHPSQIREADGFIGIASSGEVLLRTGCDAAVKSLKFVVARVNGIEREAKRINLWTSCDELGLLHNLPRYDNELTTAHSARLYTSLWFGRDQTKEGLRNKVCAALGAYDLETVARSATGFVQPAGSSGYSVRNVRRVQYISEFDAPYDASRSAWRSTLAAPERGFGFIDGQPTAITSEGSGLWSLDVAWGLQDTLSVPSFRWKVPLWEESGSIVSFTANMPQTGPDFLVLFTKGIEVEEPSTSTKKRSFDRTWPGLRWKHRPPGGGYGEVKGLATFE